MDRSGQRVAAAYSLMQERDALRSGAGGRSLLVRCEHLCEAAGDVPADPKVGAVRHRA
jgi:hypothetical protein